jgi:outer membrane protein
MKKLNLNLIIEIVLAIAIIILFALHFTGNKNHSAYKATNDTAIQKTVPGAIAYVNIDTVINKYAMYDDKKAEFSSKQQLIASEMNNKSNKYQSAVQDYQNKVQKHLITSIDAAKTEQQLTSDQQQLLQLRDKYAAQLSDDELVMRNQILNSIMEYLTEYNKDKGYNYILGNSFNGIILHANKGLDITHDVIKGLNEKYKTENKPKKTK